MVPLFHRRTGSDQRDFDHGAENGCAGRDGSYYNDDCCNWDASVHRWPTSDFRNPTAGGDYGDSVVSRCLGVSEQRDLSAPSQLRCKRGLDMSVDTSAWAIILAGGEGTRLQSLTLEIDGDSRPKQFSKIFGARSLLGHTRVRLRQIFRDDRVMFVGTKDHETFYKNELADENASRILAQPVNRGTGVAIIAAVLRFL